MGRRSSTDEGSPLTPLMFQILVALSGGDQHGYAILQEIEERTGGAFRIGAGTLYRAIKQLVDADLIEEIAGDDGHSQRRTYRITQQGRERAAADARVFRDIVAWADEARLSETKVRS
ncbi:MAG: PadR family transcriptional regulator [Acidobacteriota bacterium]|jgi:DNA-binding PadR family transcriptional regulator